LLPTPFPLKKRGFCLDLIMLGRFLAQLHAFKRCVIKILQSLAQCQCLLSGHGPCSCCC
jgi:hypothetical protein